MMEGGEKKLGNAGRSSRGRLLISRFAIRHWVRLQYVSRHIAFQEEVAISSASSRCSIMWTRQNRIDYDFELSE